MLNYIEPIIANASPQPASHSEELEIFRVRTFLNLSNIFLK